VKLTTVTGGGFIFIIIIIINEFHRDASLKQNFRAAELSVVVLGVVVSVVGRINEVNQHRARLVHDG